MPRAPRNETRSVREAARALRCSATTVHRWLDRLAIDCDWPSGSRTFHFSAIAKIRAARRAAASRKQPR